MKFCSKRPTMPLIDYHDDNNKGYQDTAPYPVRDKKQQAPALVKNVHNRLTNMGSKVMQEIYMRVFLTIDVEQDCPPFRDTYRGIIEGLPRLLQLLDSEQIPATFFTTGDVARRYPDITKKMVDGGHELGCHGDTHARLDRMTDDEAFEDLNRATETLRQFYPVSSFRAPNLQLPKTCLKHLKKLRYKIDSSEGRHKNPFIKVRSELDIFRIPASTTSLTLRAPKFIRNFFLKRLKDPVVLMVHPWEFVDLCHERLRFDCRYKTGAESLAALNETIRFFKAKNTTFLKIQQGT